MEPTEAAAGGMTATDADATDEDELPPVPWWGRYMLVVWLALVACGYIAQVVFANWVEDHPAGLLMLSARNRYLVFTVAGTPPDAGPEAVATGIGVFPYIVIGAARLTAAYLVCNLIGRAYRERVLRVFTRYLGVTPEAINVYHRGLDRAEIFIIPFFVGSNLVAALTGIRRTSPARLAALLAIGIAGRLAVMWWLAKAFEEQVKDVLRFVDRYDRWVIVASVALVVVVNLRNFRRGAAER